MKVTIEKNEIVIRIAANKTPSPSTSGKSLLVASTGGFADTGVEFNGKPLKVALNAVIKP